MSDRLIVGSQRLYVVTPEGRAAASAESSCSCRYVRDNNFLVCEYCGTAFQLGRNAGYVLSKNND